MAHRPTQQQKTAPPDETLAVSRVTFTPSTRCTTTPTGSSACQPSKANDRREEAEKEPLDMVVMISTTSRAGGKGSSVSQFPASKATIATARYVCQYRCPCWQRLPFRGYMVITRTPTQPSILCPRPKREEKGNKRTQCQRNQQHSASLTRDHPQPPRDQSPTNPIVYTPPPLSVSKGKRNPELLPPTPITIINPINQSGTRPRDRYTHDRA